MSDHERSTRIRDAELEVLAAAKALADASDAAGAVTGHLWQEVDDLTDKVRALRAAEEN